MVTRDIVVDTRVTSDMTVVLDLLPLQIPRVTVTERELVLDPRLAGFRDRMQQRSGHFFTRNRIESLHPTLFTDIFRGMASVHVGPVKGTNPILVRNRSASSSVSRYHFPSPFCELEKP